jgi:hypothetical protein
MSDSVKVREQRVRRALAKSGMRLRKAPPRSQERMQYGPGYMVVDERDNIREGGFGRPYEADLRRVEWFAFEHASEQPSGT